MKIMDINLIVLSLYLFTLGKKVNILIYFGIYMPIKSCFGKKQNYISKLKMIFKVMILGIIDIW